ncbi:uncharacterized protein LOC6575110 isoform X1 [Drosophila mojavensis]|uniref:Uncharacterized protein n=2 Tax=mojavensis species complex TaxID=198037 RepID=B4K8Z2_DROMO|nr:uncharacterized protein LOC6575110 isoform X1 [Drosophila mojavensis]XP_017871952.1 PREDICTED: uncharacterized protein LOC108619719 [Drosophila arizonae]EDW16589.1 uncharacterized protein Dmoj_GI22141 [Drosophila mojavensis]
MSNTMTAAHEPIHYLDSILNEEEKRCGDQYSHQWRNFTISRSGRFRSKNKKRDVVDGKLFDGKENDKISARNTTSAMSKSSSYNSNTTNSTTGGNNAAAPSVRSQRDKTESYKSFYETNL